MPNTMPATKILPSLSGDADSVNWFPEVTEVSGDPFTGCLEIRAGQVHLVPYMLPVSGHTNAIPRRPGIRPSIDRRAHSEES